MFLGNTNCGYAQRYVLSTIVGMRKIGERLQARARELGLSDAEVARRLGLSQNRYSNYTNGLREPDFGTFIRICRILGMTPDEVLGFGPAKGDQTTATRRRLDALLDAFDQGQQELSLLLLNALGTYRPPPSQQGSEDDDLA